MKIKSITEYGRIVKGVNTTADVSPNEISKQAKKFGNTVDKDGRPPTLSKKVKGSKTNVLFNLGLTESKEIGGSTEIYVDMDGVLADFFTEWGKLMKVDNWWNIKDEHNIDDALQKIRDTDNFWLDLPLTSNAKNLLDLIKQVKGSYIILSSPLPGDKNSEPHKREWIKKNLSFFPPKEVLIRHDKETFATQQDGTPNILIDDYGVNIQKWEAKGGVGFKHKDHKFERTAGAIKQHMEQPVEESTIVEHPAAIAAALAAGVAIKELVKKYGFKAVKQVIDNLKKQKQNTKKPVNDHGNYVDDIISAVKRKRTPDEIARALKMNLPMALKNAKAMIRHTSNDFKEGRISRQEFDKIMQYVRVNFKRKTGKDLPMDDFIKVTEKWSAKYKKSINCSNPKGFSQKAHCAGRKKNEDIEENFADGKKKGKSRPGRVKRAGASCKGSVTSLRKRAKNASGERAKMYHWCANMKSGRKKK